MKRNISVMCLTLIALSMGCQESVSPYSDNIRLLTNNAKKVWNVISIEFIDEPEGINCDEDDILTLELFDPKRNEPSYSLTAGFVKCHYSDNVNLLEEGSWRLNNAQTRIILTYGEGAFRQNTLYDILELTDRKLVLRRKIEDYYGDINVTIKTITYESL